MLQLTNGNIVEIPMPDGVYNVDSFSRLADNASNCVTTTSFSAVPGGYYLIWNSYPIYVCSDKTAKAIEILKALQAAKQITCTSVPKFIELVEKISSIL